MTLTCKVRLSTVTVSFLISGCATQEGPQSVFILHAKVTLVEAAAIAESTAPKSHAIKVELTHSKDAVYYEVEVLKRILVDAEAGHIIQSE